MRWGTVCPQPLPVLDPPIETLSWGASIAPLTLMLPPPPTEMTSLPRPSCFAQTWVLQLAGRLAAAVKFQEEVARLGSTKSETSWNFAVELRYRFAPPDTVSVL